MGETGNEERDMEFRTGLVEFFTSPNPRCGDLKVLETNDHLLSETDANSIYWILPDAFMSYHQTVILRPRQAFFIILKWQTNIKRCNMQV